MLVTACTMVFGAKCFAQTTPKERDLMRRHHVKQVLKKEYYLFRGEDDKVNCASVEQYDTLGNLLFNGDTTSSRGYGMAEALNALTVFTYDTMGNVLSSSRGSEWETRTDSFRYEHADDGRILRERKSLYSNGGHMYDMVREFKYDSNARIVLEVRLNADGSIRDAHKHEFNIGGCPTRTLWGSDLKFKRPLSTTTRECDTTGNVVVERTLMNDKRKYETRYTYDPQGRRVLERSEETTIEFRFNDRGLPSELVKSSEQRHLSFRRTQEYAYW